MSKSDTEPDTNPITDCTIASSIKKNLRNLKRKSNPCSKKSPKMQLDSEVVRPITTDPGQKMLIFPKRKKSLQPPASPALSVAGEEEQPSEPLDSPTPCAQVMSLIDLTIKVKD